MFLRTKFICIIWTMAIIRNTYASSWGLSLFVLFEQDIHIHSVTNSSWGLSLFVLFEHVLPIPRPPMVLED